MRIENSDFNAQRKLFRPQLQHLLETTPNSTTIEGLASLTLVAQEYLAVAPQTIRDAMSQLIYRNRCEFGARVAPTLLDRREIDFRYQMGNMSIWLGRKGIRSEYPSNNDWIWHRGHPWPQGYRESDIYFKRESLNPGAVSVIFDHTANESAKIFNACTKPGDRMVLTVIRAVNQLLSQELASLAKSGNPLPPETYITSLRTPLQAFNINIARER